MPTRSYEDHTHLTAALQVAVPLWIIEIKPLGMNAILTRARELNELQDSTGQRLIGSDALLYSREGDTANSFNALAESIACMSFLPGGITCFGQHWIASTDIP